MDEFRPRAPLALIPRQNNHVSILDSDKLLLVSPVMHAYRA